MPGTYPGFKWKSKPPLGAQLDPSHPLASALADGLAYNEGTGTPRSLRGTTTAVTGTLGWRGGMRDNAVQGGANYETLGHPGVSRAAFTVFLRARLRSFGQSGQSFFSTLWYDPGAGTSYTLLRLGDGLSGSAQLADFYCCGTVIVGATPIQAGATFSLAASYDGTTARLYVNGTIDGSTPVTSIGGSIGTSALFRDDNTSRSPDGGIDEFLIFRGALGAGQVASLHAQPYGMFLAPATRRFFAGSASAPPATPAPMLTLLGCG